MRFLPTDTTPEALATWGIEVDGRLVGRVSQMAAGHRYRVIDAGPYCRIPRGEHPSREAAAHALTSTRRACLAEQVDGSGLMQIERDVLTFEGSHTDEPAEDDRAREAARLGISPTLYRQITRRLRLDARAYAVNPQAVQKLTDWHEAAYVRTARFRRMTPAALARAS